VVAKVAARYHAGFTTINDDQSVWATMAVLNRSRLHAVAWPVLIGVALCIQFRAPLLGRVYFFEDVAAYFHPLWSAAARQMRAGTIPSWDPNAWCGVPLLGDPQVGVLYPLNWLWLALHPLRVYAWLQLIHAAIGATGMWYLARARGRTRAAAAVAALGLSLGAFVVLQTRHSMFVATTAWMPWLLWAIERYTQERRRDHLATIGGALGLALLAGGWSMLFFGGAVVAVYSIARVLAVAPEPRANEGSPPTERRSPAAAPTGSASQSAPAGDASQSAPAGDASQSAPAGDASQSAPAGGTSQAAPAGHAPPAGALAGNAPPAGALAGRVRLAGALAGAALLGVALAAAQLLPALAHARLSPRALGADYAFASSYAWPSWKYLLTLLVPTLFGDDARGTYVGAPDQWELCGYAIGALATVLVPLSLWHRERRRERIALLVLCVVALDLARGDGGLLHPLFFRLPVYGSLRCPARALYVWVLIAPMLAADGLDAVSAKRPRLARVAPIVIALELLITWRSENPSVKLAEATVRPEAAARLATAPGRYTNEVHLGQRFHNSGLTWGMESAGGYSSLPLWRMLHLYWIANHGAPYPSRRLAHDLTAQGLWTWSSPIVDLLNVRWVMTARDRPITARGFSRVFSGSDGIDLWNNDGALPRALVVYRARVAADEAAEARLVGDPAWRPDRLAIVDHPIDGVPAPTDGEPDPGAHAMLALVREGTDDLLLEAQARDTGVLVLAEAWHPGWRVTVDGQPAELLRVDHALRGVRLPPGKHDVVLRFVDRPLRWGAAISLLALAIAALLSRRGRPRGTP
jgi:hypothetical protein